MVEATKQTQGYDTHKDSASSSAFSPFRKKITWNK